MNIINFFSLLQIEFNDCYVMGEKNTTNIYIFPEINIKNLDHLNKRVEFFLDDLELKYKKIICPMISQYPYYCVYSKENPKKHMLKLLFTFFK